jgi:hypothetical protein
MALSVPGSSWHDVFPGVKAALAARKFNEAVGDCSVQQLSDESNSGKACLLFERKKVPSQHPWHLEMEVGKREERVLGLSV